MQYIDISIKQTEVLSRVQELAANIGSKMVAKSTDPTAFDRVPAVDEELPLLNKWLVNAAKELRRFMQKYLNFYSIPDLWYMDADGSESSGDDEITQSMEVTITDTETTYKYNLIMPDNFPTDTKEDIEHACFNFIVSKVIEEWLRIVQGLDTQLTDSGSHPTEIKTEEDKNKLLAALSLRKRPFREYNNINYDGQHIWSTTENA